MTDVILHVDSYNPGEYLAACAIFELLASVDHSATAAWSRRSVTAASFEDAGSETCEIYTTVDEPMFAQALKAALGCVDAWRAVTDEGRVPLHDAAGRWVGCLELTMPFSRDVVVIDHWFDLAFVEARQIVHKENRGKKRNGKSPWKFWAGRHEAQGIAVLVLELVDALAKTARVDTLDELFTLWSPGASGLKLDPATTRSASDRGISANDASARGLSMMRPAVELLGCIGLSAFFPPRRIGEAAPQGAVGVFGRTFRYCTWEPRAPLCLARQCGRGVQLPGFVVAERAAAIGSLGQYRYLTYSRGLGLGGVPSEFADASEEEDEDG